MRGVKLSLRVVHMLPQRLMITEFELVPASRAMTVVNPPLPPLLFVLLVREVTPPENSQ